MEAPDTPSTQPPQQGPPGAPEPPPRPSSGGTTFLKRRAFALSAIALMIVVPAVLLVSQLGGSDTTDNARTVVVPQTPNSLKDPKLGIAVSWPDGWKSQRKGDVVRLTSKDKTTAIVIAAFEPGTTAAAKSVFADFVRTLEQQYKRSRVVLAKRSPPLSGLPTLSASVTGANKKGRKQRVSLTVARGRKHVYIVEVIAPLQGGKLGDAAVIGRTIKLTG